MSCSANVLALLTWVGPSQRSWAMPGTTPEDVVPSVAGGGATVDAGPASGATGAAGAGAIGGDADDGPAGSAAAGAGRAPAAAAPPDAAGSGEAGSDGH